MPINMTHNSFKPLFATAAILFSLWSHPAFADAVTARLAMEDPGNPLLLFNTSRGDIYIEMLRQEAPNNVANFMALANGEVEILDVATNTNFRPRYFDGMRFHRVIPNFIIQAGSPAFHALGGPGTTVDDEINADALGLNREQVLGPGGKFNPLLNITSKADLDREILAPLYRTMRINTLADLNAREDEVAAALQSMTVKRALELKGYQFRSTTVTRGITRGVVALANQGPNTNGPEFFISLQDSAWLNGKYTVIGKVIEGMEVVDAIGAVAIDPTSFSRDSTVIYSVTNVE